jgi:hypothetical protein
MDRRRLPTAIALSAALALLTLLPLALASGAAPDPSEFAGFLLNPVDGFSYLAKMRQGMAGRWAFELPYAAEPGPPAYIFTFYLALGHIARLLSLPLLAVYHGVRTVAVFLMGLAAYAFFSRAIPAERPRWLAYCLFLLGSGVGWLAGPLTIRSSDLYIPESLAWTSSIANPHFPLAFALVAAIASLAIGARTGLREGLLAALLGAVLGLVQPLAVISLLAGLGGWLLWGLILRRRQSARDILPGAGWVFAGLSLGAGPWLLYDAALVSSHPVLVAWNQQNQTPSPPPWAFVTGFGLILIYALVAVARRSSLPESSWRLCIAWVVTTALLLYAPFNLQRRLVLGMALPLAALAGAGLDRIVSSGGSRRWLAAVLVAATVPSHLLVTAAGVFQASTSDPSVLLLPGERAAYEWLAANAPEGSTVLAAPRSGNRLPAFASVHVLYGHPFETPQAERQLSLVTDFFAADSDDPLAAAAGLGADFLLLDPEAQQLGLARAELRDEPVFAAGAFSLFAARSP